MAISTTRSLDAAPVAWGLMGRFGSFGVPSPLDNRGLLESKSTAAFDLPRQLVEQKRGSLSDHGEHQGHPWSQSWNGRNGTGNEARSQRTGRSGSDEEVPVFVGLGSVCASWRGGLNGIGLQCDRSLAKSDRVRGREWLIAWCRPASEVTRLQSFHRVGNAPRVDWRDDVECRSTRGALPTRLNEGHLAIRACQATRDDRQRLHDLKIVLTDGANAA